MPKIAKGAIEKAIKTGMKSVGYSGKTLDRRAVEALRGAKLGKLLSKKSVEQKLVYAALDALKKKGLIAERKDLKILVKKSISEERRQEQKEKFEQKKPESVSEKSTKEEERMEKRAKDARERLHERTAKEYIRERREETSEDRGEAARTRLGKPVRASVSEMGRAPKEEKAPEAPPSAVAKDLPI